MRGTPCPQLCLCLHSMQEGGWGRVWQGGPAPLPAPLLATAFVTMMAAPLDSRPVRLVFQTGQGPHLLQNAVLVTQSGAGQPLGSLFLATGARVGGPQPLTTQEESCLAPPFPAAKTARLPQHLPWKRGVEGLQTQEVTPSGPVAPLVAKSLQTFAKTCIYASCLNDIKHSKNNFVQNVMKQTLLNSVKTYAK